MPQSFDPYHQWLGIRDPTRPPNHYRLLGVALFESDPEVMLTAADRQMAHLRTFQHGQQVELSQRLLNEVSAAKVCLLDPDKKAEYDAQLRATAILLAPPAVVETCPTPADGRGAAPLIVPLEDAWALRRPGRSWRAPRRRRRWIVLCCLVLLALPLGGYGLLYWQSHWRRTADRTAAAELPLPQVEPSERAAAETPPPAGTSVLSPDSAAGSSSPHEASGSTDGGGDDATAQTAEATSQPPPVAEGPPPAVWEPPSQPGARPQFSASDPLGSFLLATSRRDLTAAQAVLDALQRSHPPFDPAALSEARLWHYMLQRFWQAVDEARHDLTMGQTILYRQSPVTVVSMTPSDIVLAAADGQRHTFDLNRTEIDRDLAIALVEWRFAGELPAAWRMIGSFLAVDQQGDLSLAQQYFERAEQHGFSSQPLLQLVNRQPREPLPPPTAVGPLEEGAATATVERRSVPDPSAQQAARREILRQLREERQETMTATELGKWLLQKATAAEGDPVAYYVILREALTKATAGGDLPTALSAIDGLANRYEVDSWKLRFTVLQSLSRRVKAGDRQDVGVATERLVHQAIAQDEYDWAKRLADVALALAGPSGGEPWQQRLRQTLGQIEQTRKRYEESQAASGERDSLGQDKDPRFRGTPGIP